LLETRQSKLNKIKFNSEQDKKGKKIEGPVTDNDIASDDSNVSKEANVKIREQIGAFGLLSEQTEEMIRKKRSSAIEEVIVKKIHHKKSDSMLSKKKTKQ